MTTELFKAMNAAEAAWNADEMNLELLRISDAAFVAYRKALSASREQWRSIPESDAKASAENNAYDTEGTAEDDLYWFEIALRTYEMNMDDRKSFNEDGSEKV